MRSSSRQDGGMGAEVRLALEVPRWAWKFYLRHFVLVAGISLIPALQRAVSQLWGDQLPDSFGLLGEVVTGAARLLLFVLVFRLAIVLDERLRGLDGAEGWRRMGRFIREHGGSLVVQVGLLALAFILFDRIPETVIAARVPEPRQPAYWAALLAIKNPTIIAYTMVWQIGVLRQMLMTQSGGELTPPVAPHSDPSALRARQGSRSPAPLPPPASARRRPR